MSNPGKVSGTAHQHSRKRLFRIHRKAKLRETVGVVDVNKSLKVSSLNVDGLTDASLWNVNRTIKQKSPDLCILLETKRRREDIAMNADIEGYDIIERRRSDAAGDKGGGGLLFYTRNDSGLVFKEHNPALSSPDHAFVNNERLWIIVEGLKRKTAVCGLYMGFQAPDDRHGSWNDIMYDVLRTELSDLRDAGYRVIMKGDFNCHVGNILGKGVVGNHPGVNKNGERFLNFLDDVNACHVNGACRVPGDWSTRISSGLWTRQRGGISTILDYGVVLSEDIDSVKSFGIDDQGAFPSGSDHNWSFMEMEDRFVAKRMVVCNKSVKKQRWNYGDGHDWSKFAKCVDDLVREGNVESLDVESLAKRAADILLESAEQTIGYKTQSSSSSKVATTLPREIVTALEFKGVLESNWKSKASALSSLSVGVRDSVQVAAVHEAERLFNEQARVVGLLLAGRRHCEKSRVLEKCRAGTVGALRSFWSYVSKKEKQSSCIDCVRSSDGGLVNDREGIKSEVENHLVKTFLGSMDPILPGKHGGLVDQDHSYAGQSDCAGESCHDYARQASPGLPDSDGSFGIRTDPQGWMDKAFSLSEIKKAVKKLQNCKAMGFDQVPNEFIKNAGNSFHALLTVLFNKVKESGTFPKGWNNGRISLVHKRGLRDILGNYRPLTVILSLSGLYSRVLNERLVQVVEVHKLLGEVQNGFRRGRMGADNAFILDSILWKASDQKKKVHMAFFDISKAYDSVDRDILWRRMSALGFGGQFLGTLKSIYIGDSVQSEVNGLTTRPVYLRRGLRQGCSLSPMLFNLYISALGNDLTLSDEGFQLGSVCVSGLLFADDLVVLARSKEGLLRLMALVKRHADWLNLELNTERNKSEVLSQVGVPGDSWDIVGSNGEVELSLKQVLEYKYLGTQLYSTMFKTAVEKVKQCVSKAHKYKGSCIYISRDGPDVVDMMLATWCNVAVPSILFGCEMIPFSDTAIQEIERVQCQVAKYALGVPLSTANTCAQTELGMKPFRQVLYESQLKYYVRVLGLDSERWVKQALLDHLSLSWRSPYLQYLNRIRMELGLFSLPMEPGKLERAVSSYFIGKLNADVGSLALPWIRPVKKLRRMRYTREGLASEAIAAFRYDVTCIGNKYPRIGRDTTQRECPLCPSGFRNTVSHLAFFCPSMEKFRKEETSLGSFRNMCSAKGFSNDHIYDLFVNGDDWNENPVLVGVFLERGVDLKQLLDNFLSRW